MTVAGAPSDGRQIVTQDLRLITERLEGEFTDMAGDSLLLVGGGGFLGYYLIQAIDAWNFTHPEGQISLTVYDNWMRGTPQWLSRFDETDRVTIRTVDITEPLPEETTSFDWIIHAASVASPTF